MSKILKNSSKIKTHSHVYLLTVSFISTQREYYH